MVCSFIEKYSCFHGHSHGVLFQNNKTAMYVKYNLTMTPSVTLCCSGKAVNLTHCECAYVAKVSNMHWACAILSSLTCPALQYFATLS